MFEGIFDRLYNQCNEFVKSRGDEQLDRPSLGRCWFLRCNRCNQRLLIGVVKVIARDTSKREKHTFSLCPSPKCAEGEPRKEITSTPFFTSYHLSM